MDQSGTRYKIALAGAIGWVEKNTLKLTAFKDAKSYNHYSIRSGDLIHTVSYGADGTSGTEINNGPAPSELASGAKYLSFDGHYFYPASDAGLTQLINDYNENTRKNAVNKTAFYNYFQFLPARTQTRLNAADFKKYLTNDGKDRNTPYISRLNDTEQLFINYGNKHGSNPALAFSTGIHESGWGMSKLSKDRNNYFGHAAYDTSPGSANAYASPGLGLEMHYTRFMNWNYLDGDVGNNPLYFGGFVGNKDLGMNVKYASDPYWGEKIAAHYLAMDRAAGNKDYGLYTIGKFKNKAPIYREANTTSGKVYDVKYQDIMVAITNTVGNGQWYQFTSEHLLAADKSLLPWNSGQNLLAAFNISGSQVYVAASNVDIISRGRDSKVFAQTKPTFKATPSFGAATTRFTQSATAMYPDWSKDYTTILTVPKGVELKSTYQANNGWTRVVYDGHIGYVQSNTLATSGTGGEEQLPPAGNIKYVTNDTDINLRTSPNTSSQVILTVRAKGSKLVGGTSLNGWTRVTYDGKTGYMASEFLSLDTTKPPVTTVKLGDINNDKKIDVVDMAMLQAHLRKTYTLKGNEFKAADINEDGKIDVVDMAMLQAHLRKTYTIKGW